MCFNRKSTSPTPSSALSRFVAHSRASQMRVKALAAYLFILPTAPSARVNARQEAWLSARCNKVQQCWTFAPHASELQQFSQSCSGVTNWVCSGSSLQLRQWARYWAISSSHRSRNALVITVKGQSWPRGSNWVFHSCLPSPYIYGVIDLPLPEEELALPVAE